MSRRLLAWFLLLALVPLVISNTLGYLQSRALAEDLVEQYLHAITDLSAAQIPWQVEHYRRMLEISAAGNEFLAAGSRRARGIKRGEMEEAAERSALDAYLARKLREFQAFDALYFLTDEGEIVASAGEDEAELAAWKDAGPSGLLSHDIVVTRGRGPRIRITAPVVGLDGERAGYLVGSAGPSGSRQLFRIAEHIAGRIESFVVDEHGLPIVVSHLHGEFDLDTALETPLLGLAPGAQVRYRNREGVDVIGTSASIPNMGWRYITEVPRAAAVGGLNALGRAAILFGAFFVVLVLGSAWFVASGIVAPVQRLVSASRRVGQGEFDVRLAVTEGDEIGELEQAFNEMTGRLAETSNRILELHRQDIQRAQQLATVGELASGVAHEIKNPVVSLSGGVDLIRRRLGRDGELKPILDEMERQLTRIGTAVAELLAFARPATPTLARVGPNEVVQRSLRLMQPAADDKGVVIAVELDDEIPDVALDAELLDQAIVNLLMNAVQATPRGGRVIVATSVADDELTIRVTDNGPGIAAADLEQIFKPFYTTRHTGTGLGLSISREIVERHGGRIDVRSRIGAGSSFEIILPLSFADGTELPGEQEAT